MNKLQMVAAVSAMTLVVSAPAFAEQHYEQDKGVQGQTDPTGSRTTAGQTTAQQVTPHRISKILGKDLENRKGESLGEIKDIVVDSNGAIEYVAVSAGVLGIGGDLHPVPWKALRWNAQNDDFVLDIDDKMFKKERVLPRTTGQWSRAQHGMISTGSMASVSASGSSMEARLAPREVEKVRNRGFRRR